MVQLDVPSRLFRRYIHESDKPGPYYSTLAKTGPRSFGGNRVSHVDAYVSDRAVMARSLRHRQILYYLAHGYDNCRDISGRIFSPACLVLDLPDRQLFKLGRGESPSTEDGQRFVYPMRHMREKLPYAT